MGLEAVTWIDDLVPANPLDNDPVDEGDDHLRNIKVAVASGLTGSAVRAGLLHPGASEPSIQTAAGGADVRHPTSVTPNLGFRDNLNALLGDVGFQGTIMGMRGRIHGAAIQIQGEDAGGVVRTLFQGDPDEGGGLYWQDGLAVQAVEDGARVVDPVAAGVQPILSMRNNDLTERFQVRTTGNGAGTLLRSLDLGGLVELEGTDSGGSVRDLFTGDPDGFSRMFHAGSKVLQSSIESVDIFDSSGEEPRMYFRGSSESYLGYIRMSAAGMTLESEVHGGAVELVGEDAAGVARSVFLGDPDGDATMYNAGTARVVAKSNGADIVGTLLDIAEGTSSSHRASIRNTLGGLSLAVVSGSGQGRLEETNSSGAVIANWATFDKGGAVTLYRGNAVKLRTADHLANGIGAGAQVIDGTGTWRPVGMNITPPFNISTNNSLRMSRVGHQYRCTAALTLTIDTTTNNAPDGSVWIVANESNANVTITTSGGPVLVWLDGAGGTTGARTLADGGYVTITKRASNAYQIVGNGLS